MTDEYPRSLLMCNATLKVPFQHLINTICGSPEKGRATVRLC